MDEFLEDEGKLGHGFTSADAFEEVDIIDGDRPRPTFISAKLDSEYKQELVKLLKEYKDCFAWEYYDMPGLDRSIVEHRLLLNLDIGHFSRVQDGAILKLTRYKGRDHEVNRGKVH